jgi:putative ABC transport system permease protein
MFNRDSWSEIFATISKNKLRTFLTAFSVSWGIFILVVLLGAGKGLQNGARHEFLSDAVNSIWINEGLTAMPWKGMKPGRYIQLDNEDIQLIQKNVKDIEFISASWDRGQRTLRYLKTDGAFLVRACLPHHGMLENITMKTGRFLNEQDQKESRKTCVIGLNVKDALFKKENPVGKSILVDGSTFLIVGVFDDPGNGDLDRIYIPLSTANKIFQARDKVDVIWLTTGNVGTIRSEQMVGEIRRILAANHHFNPEDLNAVGVYNKNNEYIRIMDMLDNIRIFVWIIGIGTLIAGIVGVSNIMMIVVKERTREIGIKKALGATPYNVVGQIVSEAVFITGIAGMTGMCCGIWLIELFQSLDLNSDFFRNPEVNMQVIFSAMIVLIFSGTFAGLIPALRASSISVVDALKET